ncbi:MAG: hypothetical protein PCFJNLEI_03931 [Verrucomicrobiae bacterium]|nr:hypothetical protein [Verrucomicrobiae bacterium]
MLKAKIAKEVLVKVHNEIGVLANLTKLIAEKGINILAASAWVNGSEALIHLVTDDNLRTSDTLRAKSYNPREMDVVLLESPHKPGLLRHITERLAGSGIDIHHLYASAALDQERCLIVFACADNDRAVVLLNS